MTRLSFRNMVFYLFGLSWAFSYEIHSCSVNVCPQFASNTMFCQLNYLFYYDGKMSIFKHLRNLRINTVLREQNKANNWEWWLVERKAMCRQEDQCIPKLSMVYGGCDSTKMANNLFDFCVLCWLQIWKVTQKWVMLMNTTTHWTRMLLCSA